MFLFSPHISQFISSRFHQVGVGVGVHTNGEISYICMHVACYFVKCQDVYKDEL
jgi:hypothetical protein